MRFLSALLALFVATSSQAALIDYGSYTRDTTASRNWLDLTATLNLSYDDMIGAANGCLPTCTTGAFTGWTFATVTDVGALFSNAGIPPNAALNTDPVGYANALNLITLLGVTDEEIAQAPDDGKTTRGQTITDAGFGSSKTAFLRVFDFLDPAQADFFQAASTLTGTNSNSNRSETRGIWLYADAQAVPEPSQLILVATAIFCLGITRRKLLKA